MAGPNEIDPPQPKPFEALVRRLAEEANTPDTVSTDDLLNMGRLTSRYLERFARLVAEECAKACDDSAMAWGDVAPNHPDERGRERCNTRADMARALAERIRSRFGNA